MEPGWDDAGVTSKTIAYQGEPGANSDIACRDVHPDWEPLPCASFEDAFAAVQEGAADLAMIPIDNSSNGRVADIHHALPGSGLHIVGEHFLPIHFQLLAVPGATRDSIRTVHSHIHALGQCRQIIHDLDARPMTAGRCSPVRPASPRQMAPASSATAATSSARSTSRSDRSPARTEYSTTATSPISTRATTIAVAAPITWRTEVASKAKFDLAAGTKLEGMGGHHVHGWAVDADEARANNSIPIGLISGGILKRDIKAGEIVSYDDVELDETRPLIAMRRLQDSLVAAGVIGV